MSQPENPGGKFPKHVYAMLNGTQGSAAAATAPVPEARQTISEPRVPSVQRRRGASIGTVLALILISVGSGALAWRNYGDELRRIFVLGDYEAGHLASSPSAHLPVAETAKDEMLLKLVRDVQEAQERSADRLETIIQSMASQQTLAKTTSDSLAALNERIEVFLRPPPTPPPSSPVVELDTKPAPAVAPRLRKPIARPKPSPPVVIHQEPLDQQELVQQPERAIDQPAILRR
jgi:hypothetical protein